ncbi:FAD dependent oxidoreductase [Geodermatophilus obscurus]|uniref:FAD dependent oxidoreductase n=1 Tax=Geodermatophilus obscurus TaxID=1861 RepID=A0A1I5CTK9_9ACTN|nr:FAD-dependent oxidoreductase [Geodermatophilus obscurus]SFN89991.1 FAD dependent oxidoreductase [Geodermatophilus obscurus]
MHDGAAPSRGDPHRQAGPGPRERSEGTGQVVIAGAGVAGLTAALALARQGHRVQLLDRDAAPRPDAVDGAAAWKRRGVAQFHQPHSLLARLYAELSAALPDVVAELTAQGARPVTLPDGLASLWCRRSALELVLRAAVEAEPTVDLRHAAVRAVEAGGGAVTGVRLDDGAVLPAGLVVDATGRRGRLSRPWSGDTVDVPADEAYVSRRYRLLPGAGFGTVNRGVIPVAEGDGYALLVFPHDAGTYAPLGLHPLADAVSTSNPHFGRGLALAAARPA